VPDEGERLPPPEAGSEDVPVPSMPPWIPALIALVLVALGALAVYTGLRYRSGRVDRPLTPKQRPVTSVEQGGAPGEPQAGASRILHGEAGENVPLAAAAEPGRPRVTITGGGVAGVSTTIRYSARRGMVLQIDPADAAVYVNDQAMGPARQFSGPDEVYEFAEEGKFTVRLVAPNFRDEIFVVTADPAAREEVVTVRRNMQP